MPETKLRKFTPSWRQPPPEKPPEVTPQGRPVAIDELLRMIGYQPETGVTGKVTAAQPQPPATISIKPKPGETTRYLSRREYEALGLDPDKFLREEQPPEESLYQKIQKYPIAAATTPIINIGEVQLSAGDIVGLGLIAYGAYQGARILPQLFKEVSDKALQTALNTGLDKWIAQRSRGVPAQKFKTLQDVLYNQIVKNKTWLQEQATENLLTRMGRNVNKTQAATEAVKETISNFENSRLPSVTVTNTAVPGQKFNLSEIIRGLSSKQPLSAQALRGVRGELAKQPWQLTKQQFIDKEIAMLPEGQKVSARKLQAESIVATHRATIEQALKSGQPVPPEVLKDYPDLAKAIPKAEVGQPEAGLQPSMLGEAPKEVIPAGKGKVTQISMEDQLELEEYQQRAKAEALQETLAGSPAANLTYLVKTSGKMKGELSNLTLKQYRDLTGKTEIKPNILTPDGKHVRWEYALDETATELGYPDGDALHDAIVQAWEAKQQIKTLKVEAVTPESTLATVEGVTPSKAPSKGITTVPPPVTPAPPTTGITAKPPPIGPSGKISFASLQDIQTVIAYSTKPDVSRWVANLPGIRQIMSHVNPSAIAGTPAQKFIIGRAVLREEGTQKSQGIVSYLGELGNQEKVFGKSDDNGLIASGKLKGLSVNDIRQYPKKYADRLTSGQKKWIERAHEIEEAKLKYLRDNDIDINELTFEEGGEYAGRRVFAKVSADGEILDTTYLGAGPSRVGKKAGFEKPRSYATAKEAIADGYRYIPDDEALALNVRAAYNRVADKKASEWLLTQVPWRTNGAPEELVLAAESAKMRANSSHQLVAALNRAVRGERVPDATLNSIARTYPNEAAELKRLIPEIQAGKPTAPAVQALTRKAKALEKSDNADKWAAINARARAREKAITPKIGEAMVMHPAFSGKIFTGPEAKELAETLRKSLDPGMSQALAAVNKVNAVVRYFKLAGDFSPMAIQLIFLSGSNPKIYGGAAASIPKILMDSKWQAKFLSDHKDVIDRHPGLLLSTAGTEFTEAMAKGGMLSSRINVWPKQETTLKKLGLVAPRTAGKAAATVLQPFQRVFEGTLDYAGIKMAEALEHLAKTPAEMAEVDQFINEFRGLTSSAKLGVSPNWRAAETATLLAPRYNRAIAALLVDAGKGAASFGQSGIRNRLAIQGLTKGVAALSAVALAISWARGEDWDEIKEHFDPLSPKFFTWNVAEQNIGPGSKVRSVAKLIAQTIDNPEGLWQLGMENPLLRFVRGNLAPVLGSSVDILTGRNYIGDPVRDGIMNFTNEVLAKQFLPIWVENVVYEGGKLSQRLIRGTGEFFGGRAYPETKSDALNRLYDRYAAEEYGKSAESLNKLERSQLEEKYPDLAEAKADNEKYWSERGDKIGIALDIEQQKLEDAMNKSLNEAAQRLLDGKMSKYDYDKNRSYIRPYTSGGKSALWSLRETLKPYEMKQYEKWYADNTKPEDKAYDDYQEYRATLIEKAELPLDWDIIEIELESYLNKYPEATRQYIKDRQDEWIKNLPPAARQVEQQRTIGIEDETWWDNYREAIAPIQSRPATTPRRLTPSWSK